MCQLSYSNCKNAYLNAMLVYLTSVENSRVSHRDGFGFMDSNGVIWKTHLAASQITNLGQEIFPKYNFGNGVIFHVRQASVGFRQFITADKAHPFQSKDLVLVHNGTLTYEGKAFLPYTNIDTENFLLLLQKEYKRSENNLPQAIINTYKDFAGKFAFIIYEKPTQNYYIVRGKATVYQLEFDITTKTGKKSRGVIFNTERATLDEAMLKFKNISELIFNTKIDYDFNRDAKLLPDNSIFLLEDTTVKKVGEVVEKEPYVYPPVAVASRAASYGEDDLDQIHVKIVDMCNRFEISMWEIDKLFFLTMQKPLISSTRDDLVDFYTMILKPFVDNEAKLITKNRKKTWEKILNRNNYNYEDIFKRVEFPWWMNDNKTLEAMRTGNLK